MSARTPSIERPKRGHGSAFWVAETNVRRQQADELAPKRGQILDTLGWVHQYKASTGRRSTPEGGGNPAAAESLGALPPCCRLSQGRDEGGGRGRAAPRPDHQHDFSGGLAGLGGSAFAPRVTRGGACGKNRRVHKSPWRLVWLSMCSGLPAWAVPRWHAPQRPTLATRRGGAAESAVILRYTGTSPRLSLQRPVPVRSLRRRRGRRFCKPFAGLRPLECNSFDRAADSIFEGAWV